MTKQATYYVTANDITPSRCTVTGCYTRESAAQAAVESDDNSGVFEAYEDMAEGARVWHRDGAAWSSEENAKRADL